MLLILAAGAVQVAVEVVQAANFDVTAANSTFRDAVSGNENTTIDVGDTVTWTFTDDEPHTVTSATGVFDSGPEQVGITFAFKFKSAGTFDYYCERHGAITTGGDVFGMSGTVTVLAAPTNTPPAATNTTAAGATSTAAPGATHTPTRTATPVPTSTGTVTVVPTSVLATSTPVVTAPASATQVLGTSARPAVIAPEVGAGDPATSGGVTLHIVSTALAAISATMIAGAAAAQRRRR